MILTSVLFRHVLRLVFLMSVLASLLLGVESARGQNVRNVGIDKKLYSVPLRFDVIGENVQMLPLKFEYELLDQERIQIGDVVFSQKAFYFGIFPAKNLSPLFQKYQKQLLGEQSDQEHILIFKWPRAFIEDGNIEVINRSGRVLWKQGVAEDDLKQWNEQLGSWKRILKKLKVPDADVERATLFSTLYGVRQFQLTGREFWSIDEPVRVCFSNEKENGQYTRLCSQLMEVVQLKKKEIALRDFPILLKQPKIIAFNQIAPNKMSREVKKDDLIQFYAELGGGASYEFVSRPIDFNLVELLESPKNQSNAFLTAWGPRPSVPVDDIPQERKSFLNKLFGQAWGQTIGDFREFWQVELPRNQAVLFVPGSGGGLFRVQFNILRLPNESIRPWVMSDTVEGTYVDGVKLYGVRADGTKLKTKMNSIEFEKEYPQKFIWKFGAKESGVFNKSSVDVFDAEQNLFRAYRDIYRGYPGEISTRLSALLATGGNFIFMGEVALNYWFENLFGWNQYYLARQRWGISAKYFKSFNNITLSSASTSFSNTIEYNNLDLKYRLSPGLWSRDETWGIQLSSSNFTYDVFSNQMYGIGFFWARSIPKVFDDFFNIAPFMRYPKWVDMEFIYYPTTITPRVGLFNIGQGYGNWQLNFHGKVMWGKQFFGEAGFGLKQLDFRQFLSSSNSNQRLQLTSFHGTAGIGWSF